MFKYFITICINFVIVCNTNSYAIVKDNFNILDSMVSDASEIILSHFKSNHYKDILIKHNDHPVNNLFTKYLLNHSNNINFYYKSENTINEFNLEVLNYNIRYEIYEPNKDSLTRIIELQISAYIKNETGNYISIKIPNYYFCDVVSRDDIEIIESRHSDLTKAKVPPIPTTFFEEVTEPLIIISGAIITIILLFTVRSS